MDTLKEAEVAVKDVGCVLEGGDVDEEGSWECLCDNYFSSLLPIR